MSSLEIPQLMPTISQLLIATSLDESSELVVRAGVAIARAAGARAHLLHVFAPSFTLPEWGPASANAAHAEAEAAWARRELAAQAERHGLGAEATLLTGSPYREVVALAERIDADLVVVGARTGGGLGRLLGSSADRVVRRSRRPVLVVRGDLPIPPRRTLLPSDLSPLSALAFNFGLQFLAQLGSGCEAEALFVLSVLQRQLAPQFTPDQVDRFAAEELERFVAAQGGGASCKVRAGNARQEILAEAAELGAELIVLGTHGLGGFDRVVIGSVAADVVRHAPSSVLVVPAQPVDPSEVPSAAN